MGYSISWLAVKGKPPEKIQQELDLKPNGKMADYGEASVTGRVLPNGWYLIVLKGCGHPFVKTKSLTTLSAGCDIVACGIEEHVMYSCAEEWNNGACVWRIEHAGEKGTTDLKTAGKLPPELEAIVAAQEKRREAAGGADSNIDLYFDIPLKAAKQVAGFKHDDSNPGLGQTSFQVLDAGGKKSWWKFGS
jgi:hypothetical protein